MQKTINLPVAGLQRIIEDFANEVFIFGVNDYKFALVNRCARENLGYSIEELEDLTPWDLKPEMDADGFLALVQPVLTGALAIVDFETVHARKDGSRYDVAVRLQLIGSEGEQFFYASIDDITARKETEAALKLASGRLDAIMKNTTMAIFMMDDRQECVFMNAAAEDLTGYTVEEVRGRPLHDVVHHTYPDGRHFPIEECAIDRAFPEKNQTQGEEVFVHKDGHFYPVGFTASPMRGDGEEVIGTVIEARDLSAELEARAAMQTFNEALKLRIAEAMAERDKLEVQLVQAQKMEAVGQLTGGVAHDFNNLLQVIGGNLELLQKELAGSDQRRVRVENALAGVSRGARLAAQLLAFGRQQPLDPRPTNIGRLARGLDDMLRRTLGETVEIETVISGGLWNCMADPAQLENAILNLAINAWDAMSHRGKLTIEAGNASLDDAYASAHAEVVPGQYVMLAVTDTGTGIPPEVIDKVFDPFFTTKATGEGTGLGLSMVYGFVKQSGGHIKIYSEQGQGTTVRLYFPRTRRAEDVEKPQVSTATTEGAGETILVVEDEEAVRATAVDLLQDLGYTVFQAETADAAMAVLNSGLNVDMLFTDVIMPGTMRSPELAVKARERLPGIEVLFTSGYTQNAIVHSGRLDDGVELISKPYTRDSLAQKIREVLDRRPSKRREDGAKTGPKSGEGAPGLRILLVEDEVLVRMATADMLADLGHDVIEVGRVAEAKEKLGGETVHVLLTDLGLPDGSGVDLVKEALSRFPQMAVIVASGTDPSEQFDAAGARGRIVTLSKPYDLSALSSALRQCLAAE